MINEKATVKESRNFYIQAGNINSIPRDRKAEGTKIKAEISGVHVFGEICGVMSEPGPFGYTYIVRIIESTIDKKIYPYSCLPVQELYIYEYIA